MTLFSSFAFIVQYDIVLGLMLEGIDICIGLKGKELCGSDDYSSIVGWIEEIELRRYLGAQKQRGAVPQRLSPFGMHQ